MKLHRGHWLDAWPLFRDNTLYCLLSEMALLSEATSDRAQVFGLPKAQGRVILLTLPFIMVTTKQPLSENFILYHFHKSPNTISNCMKFGPASNNNATDFGDIPRPYITFVPYDAKTFSSRSVCY